MPLAEKHKARKIYDFKNTLLRSGAYLKGYLSPEVFVASVIAVSATLAFLQVQSWFFIFASVLSVGYFGERIARNYARKTETIRPPDGEVPPKRKLRQVSPK